MIQYFKFPTIVFSSTTCFFFIFAQFLFESFVFRNPNFEYYLTNTSKYKPGPHLEWDSIGGVGKGSLTRLIGLNCLPLLLLL